MEVRLPRAQTDEGLALGAEDLAQAGIAPGSPVVIETEGEGHLVVREQTSSEMDAEIAAGGLAHAETVEELFRKLGE